MAVKTVPLTVRRTEVAPAIACMLVGVALLTLNDALIKALSATYPTASSSGHGFCCSQCVAAALQAYGYITSVGRH